MGWPKFAARGREAGVRCRRVRDARSRARSAKSADLETGRTAGEHSCRERSAEAGNAQPPGSCCVPGSRKQAIDCRERSTEAGNTLPPCLVEGSEIADRLERPTAENARRRQVTPYPLVSSEARGSRSGLSGRLPRTLGGGR